MQAKKTKKPEASSGENVHIVNSNGAVHTLGCNKIKQAK
jgi:hypothetical protein